MATKINDRRNQIKNLKMKALEEYRSGLILAALELNELLECKETDMYTCCKAIKEQLFEENKILYDPPMSSGYSYRLKIRYILGKLGGIKSYFDTAKRCRTSILLTYLEMQKRIEKYLYNNDYDFKYEERLKCYQISNHNWKIFIIDSINNDTSFKVYLLDLLCNYHDINKITLAFRIYKEEKHCIRLISEEMKEIFNIYYLSFQNVDYKELS